MSEPERLCHAIDLERIKQFVDERWVEDLHLDFKAPESMKNRDARRDFAKALSGFANSDGGVIVWGVDARKTSEEEADAACGLKLIEGIKAFVSDLQTLTGQAANPSVDGVLHEALEIPDARGRGYAKTLVPASESTPHMAKLAEDRYYKRNGSSFKRMEHFDLEDMFGRRPKPKLDLYTDLRRGGRSGAGAGRQSECIVVVGILNTGRRCARAPYLAIRVNSEYQHCLFWGGPGMAICGIPRVLAAGPQDPSERRFAGDPNVILHPDVPFEVAGVSRTISDKDTELPDLRIEFRIHAMDAMPVSGVKTLSGKDILACASEGLRLPW
jgi:hypothetical protein